MEYLELFVSVSPSFFTLIFLVPPFCCFRSLKRSIVRQVFLILLSNRYLWNSLELQIPRLFSRNQLKVVSVKGYINWEIVVSKRRKVKRAIRCPRSPPRRTRKWKSVDRGRKWTWKNNRVDFAGRTEKAKSGDRNRESFRSIILKEDPFAGRRERFQERYFTRLERVRHARECVSLCMQNKYVSPVSSWPVCSCVWIRFQVFLQEEGGNWRCRSRNIRRLLFLRKIRSPGERATKEGRGKKRRERRVERKGEDGITRRPSRRREGAENAGGGEGAEVCWNGNRLVGVWEWEWGIGWERP